ncbi:hypothetical protein CNMCM8980_000629 [Aspergillus fumigatiaffinis]|nr:hypothetical protein CNMCM5878_003897 [Aspergillus fumigatiaffinis]KAF4220371.1 hypothetical protein CNMCM6457_002464 [Aspergillus fumigatiaffinis]KAF4242149.1 hypothetical protein CNMCM8980_000629 [Aspergillus fumigatiaffinis]
MVEPKRADPALTDALSEFAQAAGLQGGIAPASASEVFQIVEDVNRKFQSSSPKTVKFSQKLSPCLESINRFSSVIDTFIQSNPTISGLVWGSLKFLLQGAMQFTSYLERLGEMFEEFGQFFPVVSEYETIFQSSDTVRAAVLHLYTDVVHFFIRAVKFLKRKPRDLIFRTLVKPFEHDYAQILKSYQTHRNELQIVALAAMERNARKERELAEIARTAAEEERKRAEEERVAAENERKEATAERQRAEQARTDIREEIKRQEAHRKEASRAREEVREETKNQEVHRTVVQGQLKGLESDSMMRWLDPPDYESMLSQTVRQRQEDTVLWIERHPKYLSWRQYANWTRDILWIYGSPGMGKTILAATIVEDLRRLHVAQSPHQTTKRYAVCFFFFDSSNVFEQPEVVMLRALVAQLLHQANKPDPLNQIYLARRSAHASLTELREAFSTLASDCSGVYVVIDGLDDAANASDALQLMLTLLVQVSPVMKLLVTSRPEPDMRRFFHSHPQFELTEDITQPDVRRVVTTRVQSACEDKKIRASDPNLRQDIVDALVSSSSGVFLWATMQVKHLQTLRVQTDRTLRAAVRNLPSGVADIYSRILAKINSYAEEDRLLAEELLRWVVCARRPLNVSELCCALAIEIGDEELNLDNVPTNTSEIADACSPLLSVGDKGTVSLVHSTVAQFLLDPSNKASVPVGTDRYFIEQTKAHTMLAEKCISYLSLLSFRNRISGSQTLAKITHEEIHAFPLLEYAALNWWKHVAHSSVSNSSAKRLVDLMFNFAKSSQGLTWLEVSITLSLSLEHLHTVSTQLRAWLRRLEFDHEHIKDLKLWLEGLVDLTRVWDSILRESPFELRSTVKKFSTEGQFFQKHFGSDFIGDIGPPPASLRRTNTNPTVAEGNTFDILIDDEEGYVLHPSGKLRFQFTWDIMQSNGTNSLRYTIHSESPITRRQFKKVEFAHEISWKLPQGFHLGLHSVAFSPDWDYMAIATVESVRGLRTGRRDESKTTIRVFLWRVRDLDEPGEEMLFGLPWILPTKGSDGNVYSGYVGQGQYDSFRGSRCAVAFREVKSTLYLQTPFGAADVETGASLEHSRYLQSVVTQPTVSQCTFSPDGRRIAMVRNHTDFEIANIDGSNVCATKLNGEICEILSISRTGRYVAICLNLPATSSQLTQSRLVVLDTVTNTLQVLLTGTQERRFDEVSFKLRGWLSWSQWAAQGRYVKYIPKGLAPVRPDRHCIQVYSVFNWLVGGASSELYIEPDIDYLLDPQEQRWDLVQPATVKRELPLSSSATYLFSDRTIRLSDSSFVLSVGFSPQDEHCCILTSKQTVLLPSSLQPSSLAYAPPTAGKQEKTTYRTYTRLFDHNRKLGCFQLSYHGTEGRWMDYLDYKTHDIAKSITARVFIWDLCGTPRLVRDQLLQLDEVEINILRYAQYRRLDVAFHPACDRMAIFNVVYNLDLITSSSVEYQIYHETNKFHPDIAAGRTNNAWQVSFSPDGKYVAFAVTASTRTPGLFGKRGEITNAVVLFETDKPSTPLCSPISSHKGDTLAMGSYLKYDDFKFIPTPSGNQIYGHPSQTGHPGFWDRLDTNTHTPQPTNLLEPGKIQLTGLAHNTRHITGIIAAPAPATSTSTSTSDGPTFTFTKKTILQLPPSTHLHQNTARVVQRANDYLVILLFQDGPVHLNNTNTRGSASASASTSETEIENLVKPILIPVDAKELAARPVSPLKARDVDDIHPLLTIPQGS